MSAINILSAYKFALGGSKGSHGHTVMEDLKNAHYINGPTVVGNIDPYTLAYNEGQRNVVLRIMSILESKEEDYGDNASSHFGGQRAPDRTDVNAAADAFCFGPYTNFKPK